MSDELTDTQVEEPEPTAPAPDVTRSRPSRPSGTRISTSPSASRPTSRTIGSALFATRKRLVAHAHERLVRELLPVLDDLERALEAAERHEEAQLVEGVKLVEKSLRASLAKEGLAEIDTDGPFDPHVHEALLTQPSDACRVGIHPRGRAARLPRRRPGSCGPRG